jgi:hypothetical protein
MQQPPRIRRLHAFLTILLLSSLLTLSTFARGLAMEEVSSEPTDLTLQLALSSAYRGPNPLSAPESRSPRQLLRTFNELTEEVRAIFDHRHRGGDIAADQEQQLVDL